MRTKTPKHNIRPRHTLLPPKPSPSALVTIPQGKKFMNGDSKSAGGDNDVHMLATDVNGDCKSNGDDDDAVNMPAKDLRHVDPQEEDCVEVDSWGLCIRCGKGGKVLVCCETGCPVVVHETCLGCLARIDEVGSFYCPYCFYKRATQGLDQKKKYASLAEKALSTYLDIKGVDVVPQNETTKTVNMAKRSNDCDDHVIDVEDQISPPRKSENLVESPEKSAESSVSKLKRKRAVWKAEEEEMLKEGVEKFSKEVNKNLPWRKILKYGRDVFDLSRSPSDLKDKWKNILAKEPVLVVLN